MGLKAAIVGLGRMGRIHTENMIKHPDIDLVAACSISSADRRWISDRTEISAADDLSSMVAKTSLDMLVIATPSDQHPHHIELATQAGLAVLCEKPLATSFHGCHQLSELSRRISSPVMVGFMRRFDPAYQQAKELIESGVLGRPILFRAYSADAAKYLDSYARYAPHSAGHFLDMCIHDFDLMHWLIEERPRQATAIGASFANDDLAQYGGDNAAALLQLESGTMAFFYTGRTAAHGYLVETEIIGTGGMLRIGHEPSKSVVELMLPNDAVRYDQHFEDRFGEAFVKELDYFVGQVQAGEKCVPSIDESNWATKVALTVEKSFQTKQTVIWE